MSSRSTATARWPVWQRRDGVLDLLTVTKKELSISVRRNARMVITGTCDEAVKAGKIREHRLADIELSDNGTKHDGRI